MLAVMAMVLGKHFPKLPRQGIGLLRRVRVGFAGLVVPDSKPGAAAVAEFKRFNRIQRVLGDFLVKDRHGTA
jgi:hypothetical protein